MRETTIAFHNDRIGRSGRKNSLPIILPIRTPSLEERLLQVISVVEVRCAALSRTAVAVECGTHRGTIYTRAEHIPIGAFEITPPLEFNG